MRAGGVGISLHDIIGDHPRVGLHSPTWSAIEMKQAIGRLYRADAKSHTKQRIVYSKPRTITIPTQSDNPIEQATTTEQAEQAEQVEPTMDNGATTYTIEESVCKNVNEKLRNISVLNDGDLHGHQDLV
jgi:hypothetical protein